jgi:hypothetical protein
MPGCIEQIDYTKKTTCKEWTDFGQDVCSSFKDVCTKWLPAFLDFVCVFTATICVGVTHIFDWVCTAWNYATMILCVVFDAISAAVNAILTVVELLAGYALYPFVVLAGLIFAIPGIGQLLKSIVTFVTGALWTLASIPDVLLGIIGIQPEKRLRVCSIILVGSGPVVTMDFALRQLQAAANYLKEKANVRLICPFNGKVKFFTGFNDAEVVAADWVFTGNKMSLGTTELDQGCDADGFVRDLGTAGTNFQWLRNTYCVSHASWRSLLGYGGPVTIFFVRSFREDATFGCCFYLSDFVFVAPTAHSGQPPTTVPTPVAGLVHELGHACGLPHIDTLDEYTALGTGAGFQDNLMFNIVPTTSTPKLYFWQIYRLRMSSHVTFF